MKKDICAKMQELDAALQTAVNVRAELWSVVAGLGNGTFADIEPPLTFYENGQIIAWGGDSEHFTPATFELIWKMWLAPNRTLSKDEIQQRVIRDDESTDNAVWLRLKNARQELSNVEFPYEIVTLRSIGYRLTARQVQK